MKLMIAFAAAWIALAAGMACAGGSASAQVTGTYQDHALSASCPITEAQFFGSGAGSATDIPLSEREDVYKWNHRVDNAHGLYARFVGQAEARSIASVIWYEMMGSACNVPVYVIDDVPCYPRSDLPTCSWASISAGGNIEDGYEKRVHIVMTGTNGQAHLGSLLHEIAHIIAIGLIPAHGPQFERDLIRVWRFWLSNYNADAVACLRDRMDLETYAWRWWEPTRSCKTEEEIAAWQNADADRRHAEFMEEHQERQRQAANDQRGRDDPRASGRARG